MPVFSVLFLAGFLAFCGSAPALAQEIEVDLELALAADGSGSIDDEELAMQRAGYAAAITDPEILGLISSGLTGKIALAYIEWGAPTSQHIIVDWTVIDGPASAAAFADALRTRPRAAYGYNSISEVLAFSAQTMESNGIKGLRQIIDVSGDGPNIGGRPLDSVRQVLLGLGMTINALVVASANGGVNGPGGLPLAQYYEQYVIGGPGAFAVVAEGREKFAEAIRRKMILEIAEGVHGTKSADEALALARRLGQSR